VVDDGLIDVTLVNLDNQPIDPDSNRLNYYGDVHYSTQQGNNDPQMVRMALTDGQANKITSIPKPVTLAEQEAQARQVLDEHGKPEFAEKLVNSLGTEQARRQFATEMLLRQGIKLYNVMYGRYPDSLAELLASGIGPFTPQSINPLTGHAYKGDGSALDFAYYATPEQECEAAAFYLRSVDAQGHESVVFMPNS
jgi:hypothetical protein